MKLRRKLIYLLATFAVFVVLATSFTVYSIQRLIEDSVTSFYDWMARTTEVSNLRVALEEHVNMLGEVVDGRRAPTPATRSAQDRFLKTLDQASSSGRAAAPDSTRWTRIAELAAAYREAADRCFTALASGHGDEASDLLERRLRADLAPALDAQLRAVEPELEHGRFQSVQRLVATKETLLILATALSVLAGALVLGGGVLIGRWLITPIQDLQHVAEQFRLGHLDQRAVPRYPDELGQLGATLNTMAASLSAARRDLHASEAKYRALFENLRDAVIICDATGRVVECHDGDTGLLGLHGGQATGRALLDVWPDWRGGPTDWPALIESVARVGRLYRRQDVELTRETDDPRLAVVDLAVYPVAYGQSRYVAILLRDARERRRLQTRVRQAEKMETAGTLAGGVAHDFNNLLTSAIGALSLVETDPDPVKTPPRIKTALRACWQAAGLSRRLLRFARGGHARPQVVRLSEMVELILSAQDESFFDGLTVRTRLDAQPLVRIDKDELTQVVLNLLRNARDAIADRGTLEITVDRAAAPEELGGSRHGTVARVSVRDDGVGMPPDVRRRIFEPFFTTKARTSRRGTGMGLAVAYSAVRGAGGSIEVESAVGAGTTVHVFLPLVDGTPDALEPVADAIPARRAGRTVLLVDDDPMVLHTCMDALETLGCTVLTAESVAQGRERFQEAGDERVSVAIIDLVLPDGSGVDLARSLVEADDQIRLVLMTGFGDTAIPPPIAGHVLSVLTKPFRLDALAAALSAAVPPPPDEVERRRGDVRGA